MTVVMKQKNQKIIIEVHTSRKPRPPSDMSIVWPAYPNASGVIAWKK